MKDEKKELQKQIGCITGFFHLFDRHRFITGQRTTKYIQNASSLGIQLFISFFFGILYHIVRTSTRLKMQSAKTIHNVRTFFFFFFEGNKVRTIVFTFVGSVQQCPCLRRIFI